MTGNSSCKSRIRRTTMIRFHYGMAGIAVAAGLCIVSASQPARATIQGGGLRLPAVSQDVIAVDDGRIVVGDNHKKNKNWNNNKDWSKNGNWKNNKNKNWSNNY